MGETPAQPQDDNPNDWIDEDMPVDSAFMDAIRDVSDLHRCVWDCEMQRRMLK